MQRYENAFVIHVMSQIMTPQKSDIHSLIHAEEHTQSPKNSSTHAPPCLVLSTELIGQDLPAALAWCFILGKKALGLIRVQFLIAL